MAEKFKKVKAGEEKKIIGLELLHPSEKRVTLAVA